MATITAAASAIYPYASLDDVSAHDKEQLDEAAPGDLAAPGTMLEVVVVFARGQQRDLR